MGSSETSLSAVAQSVGTNEPPFSKVLSKTNEAAMATEVFEVDVNKTPKGPPPSRLSSSNLTPKTAEEKAKIAEEVKSKQLAEIEDKKKKREQHAEEVKKRKEENKDNPSPCENGENGEENGKNGEEEKKAELSFVCPNHEYQNRRIEVTEQ